MADTDVKRIAQQTFDAHPELHTEAGAEELLRRTIWRLNQAGIRAGRQKNPSGAISKDKLAVILDGQQHVYDLYGLQTPLTFSFGEVPLPNYQPDEGIPDGTVPSPPAETPPSTDLAPIVTRLEALAAALSYVKLLELDESAERRYKGVSAQIAALRDELQRLQFVGSIRIPLIGTVNITLSVVQPK